ncbi:MAG: hypothetical protein U0136_21185 [Bdellovibrionota bacterium]
MRLLISNCNSLFMMTLLVAILFGAPSGCRQSDGRARTGTYSTRAIPTWSVGAVARDPKSYGESYRDLVTVLEARLSAAEERIAKQSEQLDRLENDVRRLQSQQELPQN